MNYKAEFEAQAEALHKTKTVDLPPIEVRREQVEKLTEWYFDATGKHFDYGYHLDLLASYILADHLRDKNPYKSRHSDYPALSETQQKTRNRHESRVGDDNMDFIKMREVDKHPNYFRKVTRNREDV